MPAWEPLHFAFATFKPVGKFNGKELPGIYPSGFDPTRPIGSWKKAWRKLREKAGLKGLRFHDLRHHAITELAESGTSEQTIRAIAGHVPRRMLERYGRIRMEAKRSTLEAISGKNQEGYGTKTGTKTDSPAPQPPDFRHKNGRRVRI